MRSLNLEASTVWKMPRIRGQAVLFAALTAGCGLGQEAASPSATIMGGSPAASAPDAPEPGPAAPVSEAPPVCRSADLTVTIAGGEGAAGHVYRTLRFTNHSDHTCVIQGYPGVSYVAGDDGHQVGSAAARDGGIGPRVTLSPGRSAAAEVSFTDVGVFDPAVCQPAPVRGLRVYPPDERADLYVPLPGTGCASTTPDPQLRVRATTAD
ncbi:MAG TPA: DUF4232 domain-containing protein [Pseudonocardiaceae bacterium]|nr:DUF4232 domain-containing protein [Pseudonocardiaceae bacterium]